MPTKSRSRTVLMVLAYALMMGGAFAIGWCLDEPGDQLAVMLPAGVAVGAGFTVQEIAHRTGKDAS